MKAARPVADPNLRARAVARERWGPGWQAVRQATAPGRIELLGNHLDYNGGPVLAAAIDREVSVVTGGAAPDGSLDVVFGDDPLRTAGQPESLTAMLNVAQLADWRNPSASIVPMDYVRGVVAALVANGHRVRSGLQLATAGNVPIGFGVSSSAALCVALVMTLSEGELTEREIVLLAQNAEHRAGTPCGTMDQSASVAGGVILFDANSITYERLAPDLGDYVFAVVDSGVDRSLGASAYPIRVQETASLLEIAQQRLGESIENLCQLSSAEAAKLDAHAALSEDQRKRLAHLVSETERVHQGVKAIRARDWKTFGRLMSESGRSSAIDYDVSHPDVEELVAVLQGIDGVLGARMMGGGGGGSVLALVDAAVMPVVTELVKHHYYRPRGLGTESERIHVCQFGPGATVPDE